MPDPKENPDLDQVPSQDAATEEALTLEQLANKKPEEILELYNNAIEMRKAATQRNMETAEEKRRLEAEREYWMKERQRQQEEIERIYSQMAKISQVTQQQTPQTPNYEELTTEQAYAKLLEEQRKTREELDKLKQEYEEKIQKVHGEVSLPQRAIDYREFLKEKVFPKYEYVTKESIDDWFTEHPAINPDPKTVLMAAEEIQRAKEAEIEALVQAKLREKEKLAKEADLSGAPLGSLPPGKSMIDLTEAEQAEILRRDFERLSKR